MKKLFISVMTLVLIVSCGENKKSKTETLPGTENQENNQKDNVSQDEVNAALSGMFNSDIKMDVDETVFVIDNGTNRVTEDMTAGIMKMLSPQPYEQLKARLEKEPNQEGSTLIGIQEIEKDGKKILQQKSMIIDEVGDRMIMMMHAVPAGNQTMMISSFYPEEQETKYLPLIEKSVLSARLEK
ncbi:hypothetical protein [Aquimarina sp. 2201CG5-10]|uniref:hypothetical protein n=1 Tax=Aquimarina callyspongiae TaxID=3098150 RepID=UPI002AB4C71D|nr:hypothetical protein [Aquimarina sp. 2201CG5-10]MDY8134582.1 hypothetical protein [Aquimarina sp. 2201CG5-10]